jgi:hypothetical protein
MTVTVEDTKETFTGDGATLSWPFNFKVNKAEDLSVFTVSIDGVETPLLYPDDFDVELHDNQNTSPGGNVVTVLPVGEGVPGVIMRNMSFTRVDEFVDSIPPHIIEQELDNLTMYALQLKERVDRSLHVSAATQEFANVNLRNVPARRNKVIGFDNTSRGNAVLLQLSGTDLSGPQGQTYAARVEVSAPAVFRQASNGAWSHTSVIVSFIWSANGVTELTRTITVTIDEANNHFNTPSPSAGISVAQDANKLITQLTSTFENVTEYISLAVIRMADPTVTTDTFTPTWTSGQFTSPPSGTVACKKAVGVVSLYLSAARAAESASSAMSWDAGSIPAAFRPTAAREVQCKLRYSDSIVGIGSVTIGADGSAVFSLFDGSTNGYDATFWQTGEDKGLPADWCVVYPI